MKTCTKCNISLSSDQFYKSEKRTCKSCIKAKSASYRNANPDKVKVLREKGKDRLKVLGKRNKLKHLCGITPEFQQEALKKQNYKCAMQACNNKATDTDHNHSNGKFRGMLCSNCNTGLGLFKDNPELLFSAFNYLEDTI